jgi:hypothetical protein
LYVLAVQPDDAEPVSPTAASTVEPPVPAPPSLPAGFPLPPAPALLEPPPLPAFPPLPPLAVWPAVPAPAVPAVAPPPPLPPPPLAPAAPEGFEPPVEPPHPAPTTTTRTSQPALRVPDEIRIEIMVRAFRAAVAPSSALPS